MIRTREDLAWAAGLFEGEGTICRTSEKKLPTRCRFMAALNMVDRDVVERFAAVIGLGYVNEVLQKNPKYQTQWRWCAGGFEGFQMTIILLWPWLGARRRAKAKELLKYAHEYATTIPFRPRRGRAFTTAARRLRQRAA